jgi:hypothetical protein
MQITSLLSLTFFCAFAGLPALAEADDVGATAGTGAAVLLCVVVSPVVILPPRFPEFWLKLRFSFSWINPFLLIDWLSRQAVGQALKKSLLIAEYLGIIAVHI